MSYIAILFMFEYTKKFFHLMGSFSIMLKIHTYARIIQSENICRNMENHSHLSLRKKQHDEICCEFDFSKKGETLLSHFKVVILCVIMKNVRLLRVILTENHDQA